MNLLHLRYFVELAHTQHFTRAAERLCITQPSLSHAITQLETELGVPLFERTGRSHGTDPLSGNSFSPVRSRPCQHWTRAWMPCSGWPAARA